MPEIPFNFLNRRSKTTGFRPTDLQDGQIYIQQADEAILFNNDLGTLVCVSAKTGNFVTTSQTGTLSWSGHTHSNYVTTGSTGVFALAANTGSFVTTSQTGKFASLDGSNYLCSTQIPNVTGDICINAGSNIAMLCKIQGYPVSNAIPSVGQTLQFDGTYWQPGSIPAGGNGGGGVTFYFNADISPDNPITNLPTGKYAVKELGRVASTGLTSFTSNTLPQGSYDLIAEFVTDVLDPDVNSIPAGLFDFNFWATSTATAADQTAIQFKIFKYDGSATPTLLVTSDNIYIYDPSVIAQYSSSVVIPQTSVSLTDRIYIQILGRAYTNNKVITLNFGNNSPTHIHTTIPSVGGSGLVKVINGIMQNPATLLVDADVSASAAIAGTKIQTNYFALASATGNFITTAQTGTLSWSGHTHAQYVTTGQTGAFGGSNNGVLASNSLNCINGAGAPYSIIGAGNNNTICFTSDQSAILGGNYNCILNSCISSIPGGSSNCISCSDCSFVGGGANNKIYGGGNVYNASIILGGRQNTTANSECSTILGGFNNVICNSSNSTLGSNFNTAICNSQRSAIFGHNSQIYNSTGVIVLGSGILPSGVINTTYVNNICSSGGKYYGDGSALTGLATGSLSWSGHTHAQYVTTGQTGAFGGSNNGVLASSVGNSITSSTNSFIGAGSTNTIYCAATSTITAGTSNTITGSAVCLSDNSSINGGSSNFIKCSSATFIGNGNSNLVCNSRSSSISAGDSNEIRCSALSSILGGITNCISGNPTSCVSNAIVGGDSNVITISSYSTIVGGGSNTICCCGWNTIGGGYLNTICKGDESSILGGNGNSIFTSNFSNILGGNGNTVSGSILNYSSNSSIVAGSSNLIKYSNYSFIGSAVSSLICNSDRSSIVAGTSNSIYFSTGINILGSGICASGVINTTYVNNLCITGGAASLSAIKENITTCSSVGASGLINFDTISSSSMYYTPNSTANFYLNLRGNSSCSFNSLVDLNKTLTTTFLNTNGSTAYALTGINIDGTGRTIKWLNGSGTYPAGNTGSIDSYSITAVKTGDNLYTVFGSQGKFV